MKSFSKSHTASKWQGEDTDLSHLRLVSMGGRNFSFNQKKSCICVVI